MKSCTRCKQSKPIEDFGKNRARSDGLQNECRSCKKRRDALSYQAKPEEYRQRNKKYLVSVLRKVAEYLQSHPCVDCGEDDWMLLQFDHVRGVKTAEIPVLVWRRGWSWTRLTTEIEKCEVRCAHCHIERTAESRGHYAWMNNMDH